MTFTRRVDVKDNSIVEIYRGFFYLTYGLMEMLTLQPNVFVKQISNLEG